MYSSYASATLANATPCAAANAQARRRSLALALGAIFLTGAAGLAAFLVVDTPAADIVRQALRMTPRACKLGELCVEGAERPLLESGTKSNAIWDLPRSLMRDSFREVLKTVPGAKISFLWKEPLVVYYDDILTEEEISLMIRTVEPRFSKSMIVGADGKAQPDPSRTSDTAWVYQSESPAVTDLVRKLAKLAGFSGTDNAEHIAVNRYREGQLFKPHYDYLPEDRLGGYTEFPNCQRAATVLMYLSDVEKGGESLFIRDESNTGDFVYDPSNSNQLSVKPKRGRVLVWFDMHPFTERIDSRTLHGGSPVIEGEKLAATVFLRNCTRATTFKRTAPAEESKEDL